jgi:hypothetical protein
MDLFDEFDQIEQFDQLDNPKPLSSPLPLLPPSLPPILPANTSNPELLALLPLAIYPTREALFEAIQSWSKLRGYVFTVGKSKKLLSRYQKVYYTCDRCYPAPLAREDYRRDTRTRGTSCPFAVVAL